MSHTTQPLPPEIPHNREAEESLIGAFFINPNAYFDVAHFLEAEDFYIHRLRWAYEAIQRLQDKKVPLDLLTFGEEMNSHYAEFGGPAYTTHLVNGVPTSLHAEHYAEIIAADSKRRKLLNAANGIATEAYDKDKEIEEVTSKSAQLVDAAIGEDSRKSVELLGDTLGRVYDLVELNSQLEEGEKDLGLQTGYSELDSLIGGVAETDFVLVGARPGMGKSALLLNIARKAGIEGKKKVALFSMEMSNEQTAFRLLGQLAEIDTMRIKAGNMSDSERERFLEGFETMDGANLYLSDTSALTPLKLRSVCHRLKMTHGLDLMLVDYVQLMDADAGMRLNNDTERVSYISRKLKMLAQEIHIPVISAVQLNRDLEKRQDKRPMLSDLRSSGGLEQDANQVWFLYNDSKYNEDADSPNLTEVIVAKHREGATGTVDLFFKPEWTKFSDAKKRVVTFNN